MLHNVVDTERFPQITVQQSPGIRCLVPHSFALQVVELVDAVGLALAGGDNICGARPAPVKLLHNCMYC